MKACPILDRGSGSSHQILPQSLLKKEESCFLDTAHLLRKVYLYFIKYLRPEVSGLRDFRRYGYRASYRNINYILLWPSLLQVILYFKGKKRFGYSILTRDFRGNFIFMHYHYFCLFTVKTSQYRGSDCGELGLVRLVADKV